jgi:hypothetical protein
MKLHTLEITGPRAFGNYKWLLGKVLAVMPALQLYHNNWWGLVSSNTSWQQFHVAMYLAKHCPLIK